MDLHPYILFALLLSEASLGLLAWMTYTWAANINDWGLYRLSIPFSAIVGITLAVAALPWKAYKDANTRITTTGITQPRLHGEITIKWNEALTVARASFGLHIHSPHGKIVITPYSYRTPKRVIARIIERMKDEDRT